MNRARALVSIFALLIAGLAFVPPAAADDCSNLSPTGLIGVYSCPDGSFQVRKSGTILATGPAEGTGWYVDAEGAYVAADLFCFNPYCYVTVAGLPVFACSIQINTVTFQVTTCPA